MNYINISNGNQNMHKNDSEKDALTLFVCGDVFNLRKNDGNICSKELVNIIKSADYSVCNFESPIAGFGKMQETPGLHLNQKPETIIGLRQQGFDLLLLANNHMLDFGEEALAETIKLAKCHGLDTIGAGLNETDAYQPLIRSFNGLRVGFVNGSESQYGAIDNYEKSNNAGYAWINHPNIDKTIVGLRHDCDFVIVFAHAGIEFYDIPQNDWRVRFKHFCDLGADVVIGSHPHVPQGFEKYNKSLIFYSLGNFYFDNTKLSDKEKFSYSVFLELKDGFEPQFKPVFHKKLADMVDLATIEEQVDLELLNKKLVINYYEENDRMSLQVYNKIKRLYSISLFLPLPIDGKVKTFIRMVYSLIIRRKVKYRGQMQLILFKNDSIYYAVRRALEILVQEKELGKLNR